MKYRNNLPVTVLVGAPALLVGCILGALSTFAILQGTDYFIPISCLFASLIVIASSIGLILKKHRSRLALSLGLHSFVLLFAIGCMINLGRFQDSLTIFGFVVTPIIFLIVCLHNQTVIENIERIPNKFQERTSQERRRSE